MFFKCSHTKKKSGLLTHQTVKLVETSNFKKTDFPTNQPTNQLFHTYLFFLVEALNCLASPPGGNIGNLDETASALGFPSNSKKVKFTSPSMNPISAISAV